MNPNRIPVYIEKDTGEKVHVGTAVYRGDGLADFTFDQGRDGKLAELALDCAVLGSMSFSFDAPAITAQFSNIDWSKYVSPKESGDHE